MYNNYNYKTTLVDSVKRVSLIAVITTAVLISTAFTFIEYHKFNENSEQQESEYIKSKKDFIKNEVINITEYIARERALTQNKIKARIKQRTYEAHAIATNIFNQFNGLLPEKKIKHLIIEALRPLRFFNNTGYYFIHSLDGDLKLHGLSPDLEGTNRLNYKSSTEQYVVKDLFKIIKKSGEGFLSYKYPSIKNKNKELSKVTFVKYFKPYNWSIGTGDYLENIEQDIQKKILETIEHIRFGENSYVFVVDHQGKTLMHPSQKELIGTNISNLYDVNGVNIFQAQRKAVKKPEGDYIHYVWNKPSTSRPSPKITFMKSIPDWQWMIGTGVYTDDIQLISQRQRDKLKRDLFKQLLYILIIIILSSLFIIYILNKFANRFTAEIGLFLSFFVDMPEKSEKINVNSLHFLEFKELAAFANRMLDEKTASEKSLRTSEEKLKYAQRITHFGSWEYNLKTNTPYWSDEIFRIFELEQSNTTPSYELFLDTIHPEDRKMVEKKYNDSIKNNIPYDVEHRIKLKSGKIKHVRQYGETVYDKEGNPLFSSGTLQDITELKEKEEQLKRTQKMDALGKLTGGIAHDYNNAMGVVLGYAELLSEHVAGNEKATKFVKQIQTAGNRAKVLTDKLMAFSRDKSYEIEVININQQLQQQQNLLEKTLTSRIKLNLNLEEDLWLTKIDPGDFNDAIINMIINASHAIKANGSMNISTYNIHLDKINAEVIQLYEGDYIAVSLSDTGIGVNEETVAKIFDPFFSTKGDKGTGLGLSQVYGFTKRSGGSIKVISKLEQGTEFILYFPRYHSVDTISPEINDTTSGTNVMPSHETILIVDDEEIMCNMASELLAPEGYHILKTSDPKHALEILKTEPVDLVFSDIIMPEMTGYELADEISKKYPNLKVQLTSGFSEVENLDVDIDISQINILPKPYSRTDLLRQIREVLDRQ